MFIRFLASSLFMLLSLSANAGGTMVGGGGAVVVCGGQQQIRLLEFFEAENLYGLNEQSIANDFYQRKSRSFNLSAIVSSLIPREFASDLRLMSSLKLLAQFGVTMSDFQTGPVFLGSYLVLTEDHGELSVKLPEDCELSQVGTLVYNPRPLIYIVSSLFNRLSVVEQHAFLVHEAFHVYFHVDDNRALRQFVTFIFATPEFRERNRDRFRTLLLTRRYLVSGFR